MEFHKPVTTMTTKSVRKRLGHRSPEEDSDAKHTHSSEVGTAKWTGHVTRMSDERLPKTLSMQSLGGKALPRWPEETL